jgi:hypothetical protein
VRLRKADATSSDDWIEVFSTGPTIAIEHHPTTDASAGERPALRDHGRPPRGHAPPVRPFGVVTTASLRTGGHHDVVRPVLFDPQVACELAVSGRLFDAPVPHLEIAVGHEAAARYLIWNASVIGHRRRPLPAALHLLASPSMVVTVLELVPRRRIRWGRRRFVRDGIEAIDVLAARLTAFHCP